MLKVSTQSWHYRLRAQVFDNRPKDLCSYFWSTVASAFVMVGFYIGMGLWFVLRPIVWILRKVFRSFGRNADTIETVVGYSLAALAIGGLVALTGWGIWALIYNTDGFLWGVLMVLMWAGIVAAGAAVAILVILLIAGIVHVIKKWHRNRPPKPAKPNAAASLPKPKKEEVPGDSTWTLIWGFLKGKKRKVCPLIELVGDETDNVSAIGDFR